MRLRRRRSESDDVPEIVADPDPDGGDFASVLDRELTNPTTLIESPEPSPDAPADESVDEDWQRPDPAEFWASYDEACAIADLFTVPPAAVIAVIGPLPSLINIVDRIRRRHWDGESDVVLLTDRANGACGLDQEETRPWTIVRRPDDLVAILDDDQRDAPLLVIDVPGELPNWIRSLIESLRLGGLGLVHYVLDGEPTDEDLATWHGQLGRPSVLDLASPVEPTRALGLLDRGEPIASINGIVLDAELLLALELESRVHG